MSNNEEEYTWDDEDFAEPDDLFDEEELEDLEDMEWEEEDEDDLE